MRYQAYAICFANLLLPFALFNAVVGQTTPRHTARQKAQQLYEQAQSHEIVKEYQQAVKKINEAITLDAED